MNILVVGSKGFIGSHCASHFSKIGHSVIGCDVLDIEEENYYKLGSVQLDLLRLFQKYQFDVCINAAGSANVAYSYEFPERDFELNVSLVINLLGALKAHTMECRFINFSSAAVYGNPKEMPIKESSDLAPLSPYGYHKMLSEKLLLEYHRFFKLHTCSLRVFSAYGPGLKKQLFWDIFQKGMRSDSIALYGTGNETRDFIYIADLVDAVECVIEKAGFKGETINIASGVETTICEAASALVSRIHSNAKIKFTGEVKEGDPLNWKADITKLLSLGFSPKFGVEQGVTNYYNWLVKSTKDNR